MTLIDVKITEKNNQKCASISEKALKNSVTAKAYELSKKDISEFKNNFATTLGEIDFVLQYGKKYNIPTQTIDALLDLKKGLQKKEKMGFVTFKSAVQEFRVSVDGVMINSFEEFEIEHGHHTYKATTHGKCDVSGSFDVTKGEHITQEVVFGNYPKIVIGSTKPMTDVTLMIDGKEAIIGQEVEIARCEGSVAYKADYKQVYGEDQSVGGDIALSQNLVKRVDVDFLSKDDIDNLKNMVANYKKSALKSFDYGVGMSGVKSYLFTQKLYFHDYKVRDFLRYGMSWEYGFGKAFGEVKEFNFIYHGLIEFPYFGNKSIPFHINKVVFVPYLGAGVGLGYHPSLPFETIVKNYTIMQTITGADVMLASKFGIALNIVKNFTMQESIELNIGLSLLFREQ